MAPRGRNTIFRTKGLPVGKKAVTLLQSHLNDSSRDNVDSELRQAESFLRAAIRLEMTKEERKSCMINIEIIPCCYKVDQRSALLHFDSKIPKFALQENGQPKNVCHVSVYTADISLDVNFHGFTQMYATERDADIAADIVAVHGLDGHSWDSWQGQGKAGRMWLRDYLREDVPRLRTMTYGYNSDIQAHNVDTIMDYGLGFLEEIRKVRKTEDEKERPLILIGHSFGGLLVAHSLVKASFKKSDDPLLRATVAIIFFSVPHKGLVITDIRRMLKEEHPRQDLLDQISLKSKLLADQLANFKNIVEDRSIVSFYERRQTGNLKQVSTLRRKRTTSLILVLQDPTTQKWKRGEDEYSTAVDEESALLQFPDKMETKIPVDADHSNMVKFDSKSNQTYSSVVKYLKDFAANSDGVVSSRFFSDRDINNIELLREKASNCTNALYTLRKRITPVGRSIPIRLSSHYRTPRIRKVSHMCLSRRAFSETKEFPLLVLLLR
ncbi:hypothetical protein BZA77DRAFT_78538 [Pyronema omphalodes]|nr:hypothetical protein BZA77DRAFT_78538 [Pyronema omphalodes]